MAWVDHRFRPGHRVNCGWVGVGTASEDSQNSAADWAVTASIFHRNGCALTSWVRSGCGRGRSGWFARHYNSVRVRPCPTWENAP